MRSLIAISCIFLLEFSASQRPVFGRDHKPPTLTSRQLLDDVDVLQRVYESAHPGLYRYNTKAQMDGHFATLRAEFARDRGLADSYVDRLAVSCED